MTNLIKYLKYYLISLRVNINIKYKVTLLTGKCSQLSLTVSLLISILSLKTPRGENLIPEDLKVLIINMY